MSVARPSHILRRGWLRWAAAAGGLLAAIVLCRQEITFFFHPDPPVVLEVWEDIRVYEDLAQWPAAKGQFDNEGFVACLAGHYLDSGWCLPPGTRGRLRYVMPEVPQAKAGLLRLSFFRRNSASENRLKVSGETTSALPLQFENVYFAAERIDISRVVAEADGRLIFTFEGSNPTAQPDVVLQSLEVRLFGEPMPAVPTLPRLVLLMCLLGAALTFAGPWRVTGPLAVLLVIGAGLRYYALQQVLFLPLDPDVTGFHQLARTMRLFSETGFFSAQFGVREPLFLLFINLALWIFGDAETSVRLVSCIGSLLVIGLTFRVASKMFGRGWGWLAALAMAISLPVVMQSPRGLRTEAEMIFMLLFVEAAFLARFGSPWRRAVVVGLLAGGVSLVRATYLVTLLPLIAFAFLEHRPRRLWPAAAAVLLMVGMQLPHRINMTRTYGSAFWDSSYYGQWHANFEFAGQPGWPTRMEMWRDVAQGRRVSSVEYLFQMHTIPQLVEGTGRGLWNIVRHMELIGFHRGVERLIGIQLAPVDAAFQWLGVLGLILACGLPRRRWLPLTFLSLMVPIAFYYDRGQLEAYRHTYQAFAFFVLGAVLPMAHATGWVRRRRGPSVPTSTTDETPPLRVLMVTTHFHPVIGGAERQAQALAAALHRRGHAVRVLSHRPRGASGRDVVDGVPVDRAILAVGRGIWYGLSYAGSLTLYLWKHRHAYDLIHTHVLHLDAASAGFLRSWLRRPVIAKAAGAGDTGDAHRLRHLSFGPVLRQGVRRVDCIVAPSQHVEEELREVRLPPDRIVRIPNGVDVRRFCPAGDRRAAAQALGVRPPMVCYIGRLDGLKGVPDLLQAWARLCARRPDGTLVLVGEGRQGVGLRQQADSLGLDGRVVFAGEQRDVLPYVQASDVFVLPSLAEGMSNALLEAMACGVACVALKIRANAELITDGQNGVLVDGGDPTALAAAIERLLADGAMADRLGRAARDTVLARFSIERIADQYETLYRRVLGARNGHA